MSSIRVNIGYVYLMELMPKKAQTPVTSGRNVLEAFIFVLATLYFWQINKHWIYFVLIGYSWNIISVIGMYWMPESPRYLLNVGKYDEAIKVFQLIASWNKKEFNADDECFTAIMSNRQSSRKEPYVLKIHNMP